MSVDGVAHDGIMPNTFHDFFDPFDVQEGSILNQKGGLWPKARRRKTEKRLTVTSPALG